MMRCTTFRRKLLSQAIIAGLSFGTAGSVLAGADSDFYLTGNAVTVGSSVATVGNNGVISTTTVTRTTNSSTLPNVTLPLSDLQTASTHTFRVGMQATLGTSILEVRLGVVTLATDANGDITSFDLADAPADPGFEKTYAWVRLNGNVTVTAEFNVPSGMISRSGNNLTLNMSTIINEISAQGAVADALAAFTTTGTVNYKLALYQTAGTDGAGGSSFGHYDSNNTPAFTASTQNVSWNDATLSGNFAGASVLSGSLVILAADTGGGSGGGTTEEPDDTTTVDETDINELDSDTTAADQQVDEELNSGSGEVSPATVTQTETVTNTAATQTETLVSGSTTGTISTPNTLNVLATATSSADTGGKVANSTTTADKTTVTNSTKTIIKNTGTLLTKIADSGTTITTEQKTQVQGIIVNLANAAKNITGGSSGKATTATEMKKDLETAFKAATTLKVPLSDEAETTIKEAAVSIQVAALAELTGKNSEDLTQEDLQEAFNDPETREKVLGASPKLPLKNPRSDEEIDAAINDYITANYPAKSLDSAKAANKAVEDSSTSNPGEDFGGCASSGPGLEILPGVFISPGNACDLKEPLPGGAQTLSASEPSSGITVNPADMTFNPATATTLWPVGDDVIKLAQLGQRAVPAGLTLSVATQPDGRMTIIGSQGIALDLAPTAEDTIALAIALDELGFPMAFRDDGSFELALAGDDKFTGTFGFEVLPADDRAACGDMTFTPTAGIEVNQPDYAFVAECENGISQNIAPFVAEAGLYESLANGDFTVSTNRSTGVITVEGVGEFKPSFFSSAPTEAEAQYQAANADSLGISYMPMDINGDGRMDFKVITPTSVQVIYAVP